jgi:peroxin-6
VSQGLPFTYTGADMYALCSDAMLKAITRQARAVDKKVKEYNDSHDQKITIAYFFDHLATEEDTAVMVTEQDYIDAHKELVPSVSADELRHYDRVRRTFEGAGKQEEKKQIEAPPTTNGTGSSGKGKGKAVAPVDEAEQMVIQMENTELNGDAKSGADGSTSGKGKGKAPAGHASKSSVDIAEGGFGDAGDDDELYG